MGGTPVLGVTQCPLNYDILTLKQLIFSSNWSSPNKVGWLEKEENLIKFFFFLHVIYTEERVMPCRYGGSQKWEPPCAHQQWFRKEFTFLFKAL